MPLNLNKAKIKLTTTNKLKKPPAVLGNMLAQMKSFEDTPPQTAEGEIAFNDLDTRQRYIRLQKKGLNILRTEIIAISEFIPVAVGDDSDNTNKSNYNLGDNKQVSTTNVARLIELHRQVREYVINAAEVVMEKVYPDLSSANFLEELRQIVNQNFNRSVALDIAKTVDNVILSVKEVGSASFRQVVIENENNAFLVATIEYFVYENLIEEIVRYLGSVAQIDEKFQKFWSIEKFHNFRNFTASFKNAPVNRVYSNSETFLDDRDRLLNNLISMYKTGTNSDTDVFVNIISHLASLILLKDSSSVLMTAKDVDDGTLEVDPGEVRYGLAGDLSDAIDSMLDIKLSGMLCGFGAGTGKDRRAINASVRPNLVKVSDPKLKSIFTSIENASGETINDESEGINEMMIAMAYDFVTATVGLNGAIDQLSPLGSELRISDGIKPGGLTLLTYLGDVLGVDKEQLNPGSALEFTRQGLPNIDVAQEVFNGKEFLGTRRGFGKFGAPLIGVREFKQGDRDVFYSPLESTNRETTRDGQGYIPATQFFIEAEIERSGQNIEFKDLDDFVKEYEELAKNLQNDILTLVPDSKLAENSSGAKKALSFLGKHSARSHLEYLNRRIAKDLEDIVNFSTNSQTTLIPQLAIFIQDQSGAAKVRNFQAAFWGHVLRQAQDNRNDRTGQGFFKGLLAGASSGAAVGAGVGALFGGIGAVPGLIGGAIIGGYAGAITGIVVSQNDQVPFRKPIAIEKDRKEKKVIVALQHFMEFYLETAIIDFLENACNLTFRNKDKTTTPKQKFPESGVKYETFIRGKNQLPKGAVKGAIPDADKPLNSDASDLPRGQTKKLSISHKELDNVFGKSFGDKGKYLDDLVGKNRFNTGAPEACVGFYRMFRRTLANVHFSRNTQIESVLGVDLVYNGTTGVNVMFTEDEINEEAGKLGGLVGFSAHHRSLIILSYIHNLLRKTVQVYARTGGSGGKFLELKVDYEQIQGLRAALLGTPRSSISGESKLASYDAAKKIIDDLFEKYDAREQRIRDCVSLFSLHASGYKEAQRKAVEIVDGVGTKSKLAINTMKDLKIYKDALTLNNDEAPSLMTQSFQKNYLTAPGSIFPRDIYFSGKKNKFMFKYLSEKGYGFLEEEKRGNKSLIHVGIPNSMISALQINAFEETDDVNYLNSPYVCISVFKKSHLYPSYDFYPKNYIFDTSANILDYNPQNNELARHLKDFKGNASFNDLLRSVEITRTKVDENGKQQTVVSHGFGSGKTAGIYDKDVLINHVSDYVLKEYCKLTTGLDFDEDTFLLRSQPLDFDVITPTGLLGDRLNGEYNQILAMLQNIYPEAETDPQLKSEVFRLTKILKQSAPFSFVNRFTKSVTPKSFDRVYSILVNEKDFILNSAENIFSEPVQFHINSKIQRPDKLKSSFQHFLHLRANSSSTRQDSEIVKYAASISENYPEVYNYSIALSLLPLNFEDGAVLKPPKAEAKSSPELSRTPLVRRGISLGNLRSFKLK